MYIPLCSRECLTRSSHRSCDLLIENRQAVLAASIIEHSVNNGYTWTYCGHEDTLVLHVQVQLHVPTIRLVSIQEY